MFFCGMWVDNRWIEDKKQLPSSYKIRRMVPVKDFDIGSDLYWKWKTLHKNKAHRIYICQLMSYFYSTNVWFTGKYNEYDERIYDKTYLMNGTYFQTFIDQWFDTKTKWLL